MQFNVVEFFVGAGGSHLGFMQNDFSALYVNDFDSNALKTLLHNNPKLEKEAIIDSTDITKINPKELKKRINADIDVVFGGIVRKGFSLAGERSPADERNQFYRYYLEIIKELKPKISVIENVKGMLNAKILDSKTPKNLINKVDNLWQELENYKGQKAELRKKNKLSLEFENYGKTLREKKQHSLKEIDKYMINVIDDILRIYKNIGYKVSYKILNAAWYGAATKRERLIIVAVRNDIKADFKFPLPRFYDESIGTKLDFDKETIKNIKFKKPIVLKKVLGQIDYTNTNDEDNKPMNLNKKTIERFQYVKPGSNISDNLETLPKHLKVSKFYSRGSNLRLDFNSLAPTLVPKHSAFPLHPKEHRSITIREAASITGFPPNYKFFGNHSKRCEQVGNAVPPPLSFAIAKAIKETLIKSQ